MTPEMQQLAEYHQSSAISSTFLKAGYKGPMSTFFKNYVAFDRVPFVPTEAMRQGSFVDALCTQPSIDPFYKLLPDDMPRRPTAKQLTDGKFSAGGTKAHSAWVDYNKNEKRWQDFESDLNGREVVPFAWILYGYRIRKILLNEPIGLDWPWNAGQTPHYWTDPVLGPCRYMPDLEDEHRLIDLKKTRNAAPHAFDAQAGDLAYEIQLAHYCEGYRDKRGYYPKEVWIVSYEWENPERYCFRPCPDSYLETGRRRRLEAFQTITRCKETNSWPSYKSVPMRTKGQQSPAYI